uniref:IKAROS family zinc finger 4 n=1 Tax=Stegastes partitus TaxID=144197 RepID=A0A3B5A5X2_9TELE
MDVDDCNGRSYISASGDSSMEREFSGALGGPTVSTPNSKENSPSRSLSANSIKVELYSDEDPGRSTEDERGERVEEGGQEQGSEAVGGYRELTNPETMPSGATRLPNGKLKCDICGMICIGPNVLMVHKRSHTGERPFQCNQCGASFTQKGNLLRHIKLHSGEKPFKCPFCSYACRRRDALTGHLRTHAVSSPTVGKPYKCSYCGRSYKQQSTLEEHRERCHSYLQSLESQHTKSSTHNHLYFPMYIPDSLLQPSSDKMTFIDRLANSITKRKRSTPQKFVGQKHIRLNLADAPYELTAGLDKDGDMHAGDLKAPHFTSLGGEYTGVAGNGGGDSTDTESMPDEPCNTHPPIAHHRSRDRRSPSHAKDRELEREDGGHSAHPAPAHAPTPSSPTAPSSTSREAFRVVDGEGRAVRSFRCEHCRVLFLDHVMFTIHMGCHGFRQPFECNICGHRSQDRYEFSSHIVRGEHVLD